MLMFFRALFFFNCCYTNMHTHRHIYTDVYKLASSKYILLILHNVHSVYVFMADHLVLGNQLVWFSQGRLFSPPSHSFFAYSSLCGVEDLQVLLFLH